MRKFIPLVLLTFSLFSCSPNENPNPTSFSVKINGDVIQLENPEVLIKKRNGNTFSQEIKGEIIIGETAERVLILNYFGDLDDDYSLFAGIYYENDYKDSWSCFCPDELELTISSVSENRASGNFGDFDATGDLGTVRITEGSFANIPIDVINL